MKRKKTISIVTAAVLSFGLLGFSSNVFADEEKLPTITATPKEGENCVHLDWTAPDADKYYSYKIFSKEFSEPLFQSIPSKAYVKVLNIYPGVGDNLKEWMNEPSKHLDPNDETKSKYIYEKDENGNFISNSRGIIKANENNEPSKDENGEYVFLSKGLIEVDEVDMGDSEGTKENTFNNNPEYYLKDDDGNWKYDVVYEGGWDGNNHIDLSEASEKVIEEFIESGRGFLAGHNTVNYPQNMKLEKYLNNTFYVDAYGGGRINVSKKGLLTNYPWEIGPVGTELVVPPSHTCNDFAMGDVWFKYSENTLYPQFTETTEYKGKSGTNNFYLTTWNNTAIIETGHSSGKATPDEQRVLANTIFYLAQVTEDVSWDDHKGQDITIPTKPTISNVSADSENGSITVKYNKATDVGTNYDYYVEATEKSTGIKTKSESVNTTITSGFKGYSILVDENEGSIPDSTIETTSNEYTFNKEFKGTFYIHVAAVDNADNISEVSTYKYSYPTLTLTPSTIEKTSEPVTITATASSEDYSIAKIITPDGNVVEGNSTEYIADENGTYTFVAIDTENHETTSSIDINNIVEEEKSDLVFDLQAEKESINLNQTFFVDLNINNIKCVLGEELVIKYDTSKLDFTGFNKINGIVIEKDLKTDGVIRIKLKNSIFKHNTNTLLRLKFKAKCTGEALIDITKANVRYRGNVEKEISDENCGQTIINIRKGHK